MKSSSIPTAPNFEDMLKSKAWTADWHAGAPSLPISFVYDDTVIHGIPAEWSPVSRTQRIDANLLETVYEGREPASGLSVRLEWLEYLDYPVVEWTAWLTNSGSETTPLLDSILALDSDFAGAPALIQHCNGDYYSQDGYTPSTTALNEGDPLVFAPHGGACQFGGEL